MNDITLRQIPFGQYEYVTVEFPVANTDVVVPYHNLKLENAEEVRWLDVSPDQGGLVFRGFPGEFEPGRIRLQSNLAGYKTRLLLFTERNQSNA